MPPRSTMAVISTGSAPNPAHDVDRLHHRRPAGDGVLGDHDLVARLERPGDAPGDPVVLGLLAHAEAAQRSSAAWRRSRRCRRPSASAPIVRPPIAVASSGMISSAASATSTMPSGRHDVCLVSRNHELRAPDLSVNSPRLTAWASTCARSASSGPGSRGSSRSSSGARSLTGWHRSLRRRVHAGPAPHLHRTPAGRDVRRPPRRRSARRDSSASTPSSAATTTWRWAVPTPAGLPGPTDAWITLAGLARDTSTIRLGTLVTSATFRLPGLLAISVANVDQMSGGRVELGLGAGWYRERARGVRPSRSRTLAERFDRLEEQLEVITGLWQTPPGRAFRLRRQARGAARLTGAPQAGAAAGADHHRRRRAGAGRRRWPPASPPSSTCRSARSSGSSSNASGWSRRARRSDATRRRSCSRRPSPRAVGATRPSVAPARRRVGSSLERSAPYRRRRHDRRGGRNDAEVAGGRRRADVSAGPRPCRSRPSRRPRGHRSMK